ncbi:MAG: acyltransferase 3, partial [Bradyrhizobium sp.]|nr:acyltransferase 3 [Bradyrhizobium sp.]
MLDDGSTQPNYRMIQALRAIAALLVVLLHCDEMLGLRIGPRALGASWHNGAAGVDIFFVISGFIMTISSRHLVGETLGWLTFLKNRIVRIVPLYWLLTTLKLVAVLGASGLALRSQLDVNFVTSSYAFLPLIDSAGHFRPLLPVGWTLTFEFLFSFVFAVAIARVIDPIRVVLPVFASVALIALFRTDSWSTWAVLLDPIVLEFVFGVVIAKMTLAGMRLTPAFSLFLLFAGFALLFSLEPATDNFRVLVWGLPAAMIVAASVSLERELGHSVPRWLSVLGDASYSIYLSHGFFVATLGASVIYLRWSGPTVE